MKRYSPVKKTVSSHLGRSGERAAVRYLRKKGFRILETNYRFHRGEIDIIALDRSCLVFVEVKTRTDKMFGFPEECVPFFKQKQIRWVAQGYLVTHAIEDRECRFDVIAITLDGSGRPAVQHFKNAFE